MRTTLKPAIVAATTALLISFSACATITPVTELSVTPRDREIQVVTVGGNIYYFKNWEVGKDSAIIGFGDDPRRASTMWRRSHILPADSIRSVALVDRTNEKIGKTSVMILGITAGLAVLWLVITSVSAFAGLSAG